MRALLVVNPNATTTNTRTQDVLIHALAHEVNLTVVHTKGRGHAIDLAKQAVADSTELIVSLGGDGTINEIVNGLLAEYVDDDVPADDLGDKLPILGVVPGGSTNVFCRALGLPSEPVDATGVLLEAIREQRIRSVGLGRANDRWFTFCAGFGIDAAVVRRVEQARRAGKKSTGALYLRQATAQLVTDSLSPVLRHRLPDIELELDNEQSAGPLRWALVQNTAPWTFLGNRAIHGSPQSSFDSGLDLTGIRSFTLPTSLRVSAQLLLGKPPAGSTVLRRHDLTRLSLRATAPLGLQLDGEYLGEETSLIFSSAARALRIAG